MNDDMLIEKEGLVARLRPRRSHLVSEGIEPGELAGKRADQPLLVRFLTGGAGKAILVAFLAVDAAVGVIVGFRHHTQAARPSVAQGGIEVSVPAPSASGLSAQGPLKPPVAITRKPAHKDVKRHHHPPRASHHKAPPTSPSSGSTTSSSSSTGTSSSGGTSTPPKPSGSSGSGGGSPQGGSGGSPPPAAGGGAGGGGGGP